jgi:CRISPR-associated protein Csd1
MSWMQKLYQTYDRAVEHGQPLGPKLWPLAHFLKKVHVEVVIDGNGNLRRIKQLTRAEAPTLIPVTEASVGRTGKLIAPHPLCEELSYCAGDLPDATPEKHTRYLAGLESWCESGHSHPKAKAVLAYVKQSRLWSDLNAAKLLPLVIEGAPGKSKERVKDEKVFIRWRIESADTLESGTWEDDSLIASWFAFDKSVNPANGMCNVLGTKSRLGKNHPKFIRGSDDGAKLISANDDNGYTFRGRFTDKTGAQACGVGYEVTQKAHNALRWLIQRQSYRNGDQVIVSWAVGGAEIPDPFGDSYMLTLAGVDFDSGAAVSPIEQDAGQAFANRLALHMKGYHARLGPSDDIVVMGLDSATPGRMAITYYRELTGSEFLERIERWHTVHAWQQNYSKDKKFVGAPAPRDIAEAVYGRRLDDKLKKVTVERLLPCIVDGQPVPRDLIESAVRRTSSRTGMKRWEWEKTLGIACALYRGVFKQEEYKMGLETDRHSRDYLFGRLLAIAEHIESRALYVAGEERDTTASKLMQRFADRPASTWRIIEPALKPYISRLRAKRTGFMFEMDKLLDEIIPSFIGDDFLDDRKLSGEFLLGYHCQRQALSPPKKDDDTAAAETDSETIST